MTTTGEAGGTREIRQGGRVLTVGAPDGCCVDCLMWLANGETDPEWTDEQRQDWRARFDRMTEGTEVTLGMLAEYHSCTDDAGNIADDCECEDLGFSWSACATCGSTLGGNRDAVTFWIPRDDSEG